MNGSMMFFLSVFSLLFSTTAIAQNASEYFLPLSVGSHTDLYTPGSTGGWGARTTSYSVDAIESISGKQYFKVIGRESAVLSGSHIFQLVWVRKDSVGNIVLGAIGSENGSTRLDSATLMTFDWFPNQFLSKGYARTYSTGGISTQQDSVVSISETVVVSAGTFTNCLKIMETQFEGASNPVFREYNYYARGIGLVKTERTLPAHEVHTDGLTTYGTTDVADRLAAFSPGSYMLSQNYPNPFNPSTTISFSLPTRSFVSLKIFDVMGRETATIVSEELSPGTHTRNWNGIGMPSGVYFYGLRAGTYSATRKLLLMK